MTKWIKNNSGVVKTYLGQQINDQTYYEIQPYESTAWANDSLLLTDIGSGDAIVAKDDSGNSNIVDINNAINYLKDIDIVIKIQEEDINTGGHYQAHSFELDIDQASGEWKALDISFPLPVSLLSAEFTDRDEYRKDVCEFQISPDTTIGTLTTAASTNDTVLDVAQSVIDNIKIGYWVTIGSFDAGRCISIDKINNKITVENGMDQSYSIGTLCKITVKMLPRLELNGGNVQRALGESKIGGSYIKANTIIRLRYQNNDGITKRFSFVLEYLY